MRKHDVVNIGCRHGSNNQWIQIVPPRLVLPDMSSRMWLPKSEPIITKANASVSVWTQHCLSTIRIWKKRHIWSGNRTYWLSLDDSALLPATGKHEMIDMACNLPYLSCHCGDTYSIRSQTSQKNRIVTHKKYYDMCRRSKQNSLEICRICEPTWEENTVE